MLALAGLLGCGEDEAPVAPLPPSAKRKTETAAPVAVSAEVDYVYNPLNKRDPFRPTLIETVKGPVDPGETAACTQPLCLLDLDELSVVAVVSGDANPMAMVEDRSGVGHIVRRNTSIGKQVGKVTQILRDCIVVTWFTGGADGKPQANKQNLCVKTDSRSVEPLDLLKGKEFTQ